VVVWLTACLFEWMGRRLAGLSCFDSELIEDSVTLPPFFSSRVWFRGQIRVPGLWFCLDEIVAHFYLRLRFLFWWCIMISWHDYWRFVYVVEMISYICLPLQSFVKTVYAWYLRNVDVTSKLFEIIIYLHVLLLERFRVLHNTFKGPKYHVVYEGYNLNNGILFMQVRL